MGSPSLSFPKSLFMILKYRKFVRDLAQVNIDSVSYTHLWSDFMKPVERLIYKVAGVNPEEEMNWKQFLKALLILNAFWAIGSAITTNLGNKMNVIVIMVLTTLIGGFSILTGNFTPAYLITCLLYTSRCV